MKANSQTYICTPNEAMRQGLSIFYRDSQDVRVVLYMSQILFDALNYELEQDSERYKINNRTSISEVLRSLLMVALRLKDKDIELFHQLRDF